MHCFEFLTVSCFILTPSQHPKIILLVLFDLYQNSNKSYFSKYNSKCGIRVFKWDCGFGGLTCHLGKCQVLCQVAGESCPIPAERMNWLSWGIMWVEKEVFYEQNQHRGREEEEVLRVCTEPPGEVGTAGRGVLSPWFHSAEGSFLLGLLRAVFVCVYILWFP